MADPRLAGADVIVSGGDLVVGPCARRVPRPAGGRRARPPSHGERRPRGGGALGGGRAVGRGSMVQRATRPGARGARRPVARDRRARPRRARRGALLPRDADVRPPDPDPRDPGGGRRPASSATSPPTWSSAGTRTSSTTGRWAGSGSSTPEASGCPYEAIAGRTLGVSSGRTASSFCRRRTMPSPRSTTLSRTGFPLSEQWLAPVLRSEVTAEEATDEFERRRRGA